MGEVFRSLFAAVLWCLVFPASGWGAAGRAYFKSYGIRNGLSQNTVLSAMQDRQGFMWFGTKDGLNRFDGTQFRTFIRGEHNEYHCSFVSTLYEASDGSIWIGTDQGVCIYDPEEEAIAPFLKKTDSGRTIRRTISQITADTKGRIWIVEEGGRIYCYDEVNGKLKDFRIALGNTVTSIAMTKEGRIWVGTFGGGLFYTDDSFRTLHQFADAFGSHPFSKVVVTKIAMHSEILYVATERGLIAVDPHKRKESVLFSHDDKGYPLFVRDFLFAKEGTSIYVGTEKGLYLCDLATKHFTHYVHSLFDPCSISDNAVYSLAQDREGGVWIGTYFGGVSYLPGRSGDFQKYYQTDASTSLHGQQVREFCEDSNGRIWIGTEDAGLNCYDPVTDDFHFVEASRSFRNVHGLHAFGNELWVGTFASGLKVLDTRTGRLLRSYTAGDGSGLNSDYVFRIIQTQRGERFIGTMSGLQRWDKKTGRFSGIPELRDIFVYDICEDHAGNLWVATYANGLYLYDRQRDIWLRYHHTDGNPASLPSDRVVGVFEDSKGKVWVMTQAGLCSFSKKDNRFDPTIGGLHLPGGIVYQMQEDNSGNYWISTNRGLYCVSPNTKQMSHYTTDDGLLSNQFNYRSSMRDSDGRLYFGCIGGFIAFMPQSLAIEEKLPTPVFVDMWLGNDKVLPTPDGILEKSISLTDKLILAHDQNSISFKVASLSYGNPSRHRLKYKLEGFDNEWNELPHPDSRISYSNLGFGSYVLKVVAYNENFEHYGAESELSITIRPPFYLSVWAWIVYSLLAAGLGYWFYRRVQWANLERSRKAIENFTREKEKEVYNAKIEFFTNVAHEIRTPLSLIKAPLESIIEAEQNASPSVKADLEVMNMNVDRLLFLSNQLLDFRKVEDSKFQIHREICNINDLVKRIQTRFAPAAELAGRKFRMRLPEKEILAAVDKESFTKIVSNLFTNAIKYGKTYIDVVLDREGNSIVLFVKNDGAIVPEDKREEIFSPFSRLSTSTGKPGAGIGLSFARSLAQLHGGTLSMEDSMDENIFVLRLPADLPADVAVQSPPEEEMESSSVGNSVENDASTILVVEDNEEMRNFLKSHLVAQHYNVLAACNGKEALDVVAKNTVNLVVSDIMMPKMDGLEMVKVLKSDFLYSQIPVILLTAKTNVVDKISGIEAGADAYIEKPFSMRHLLARVAALLKNAQRIRENMEKHPIVSVVKTGDLSNADKEFLQRLDAVVRDNFANPDFSMDSMVEILNMSRSSFYRRVKGILDMSPNDYIRMVRLRKAAALLKEGAYNVTEICYMVGFGSPSYFSKCFHKQFGVLPKDYS